jgi:hypothetical protein
VAAAVSAAASPNFLRVLFIAVAPYLCQGMRIRV